ncbi:phage tail protein [Gryllotalpicola koreensis]|uniref:Tail fiber protein n=1 Tax=Gryllotalpicola koreensis TaxID=993086 RepID=A0ABP7ZQD1_9MICO
MATDQYIGEIRAVGFNFAPSGWALCNGQLLPIAQNTALFSILGTQYGGNGTSTFALPNLNGAAALGQGAGPGLTARSVGESGGAESVTLSQAQLPAHTHAATAVAAVGTQGSPSGAIFAEPRAGRAPVPAYAAPGTSTATLSPTAVLPAGGGLPHNNLPPSLAVNYIIALQGNYPSRG